MTEPAHLVDQVLVLKEVDMVIDLLNKARELSTRTRHHLATMPGGEQFGSHVGFLSGLETQLESVLSAWEGEYELLRDAFESKEDPPCPA